MSPDQLRGDRLDDVAEREGLPLLGELGMEYHLQQKVSEFIPQFVEVAARDGISDLVGLLDSIGCDRREALREVPRAASVRISQSRHDGDQVGDVARRREVIARAHRAARSGWAEPLCILRGEPSVGTS